MTRKKDYEAIPALSVLANQLPDGKSYRTLYRWATVGLVNKSGKPVIMETRRETTGLAASLKMYDEFLDALQR